MELCHRQFLNFYLKVIIFKKNSGDITNKLKCHKHSFQLPTPDPHVGIGQLLATVLALKAFFKKL